MVMLCAVAARVDVFAKIGLEGAATTLRSVRVVPAVPGGVTTVVLEADGLLPEPPSAALDGPPRIYLDLKGVKPAPGVVVGEPDPLVLRTRVAVHSANPLVTRVVIDMVKAAPYRIDASGREQGRLVVILGVRSASAAAPPPLVAVSGRKDIRIRTVVAVRGSVECRR